jgi:hypothetical protein
MMRQYDDTSKSSRTSSSLSQHSKNSISSVNDVNLNSLNSKYRHLIEEIIILKRIEHEKSTRIEEQRRIMEILGMKMNDGLMIRESISTFDNFAFENDFDQVFIPRKSEEGNYLVCSKQYRIDRPERFTQEEICDILKIVKQHEEQEQHSGKVYMGRYKLDNDRKIEKKREYEPILRKKKDYEEEKTINKPIDRLKSPYSVTFPQIETKLDEKPDGK